MLLNMREYLCSDITLHYTTCMICYMGSVRKAGRPADVFQRSILLDTFYFKNVKVHIQTPDCALDL